MFSLELEVCQVSWVLSPLLVYSFLLCVKLSSYTSKAPGVCLSVATGVYVMFSKPLYLMVPRLELWQCVVKLKGSVRLRVSQTGFREISWNT